MVQFTVHCRTECKMDASRFTKRKLRLKTLLSQCDYLFDHCTLHISFGAIAIGFTNLVYAFSPEYFKPEYHKLQNQIN